MVRSTINPKGVDVPTLAESTSLSNLKYLLNPQTGDIALLVSVPWLIAGLLVIAAVVGWCWWSLREER